MTNDDDGAGVNSGRFVIAVTAVGANMGVDEDEDGKIADTVDRQGVDPRRPPTPSKWAGYRIRLGKIALIAEPDYGDAASSSLERRPS